MTKMILQIYYNKKVEKRIACGGRNNKHHQDKAIIQRDNSLNWKIVRNEYFLDLETR